MWADTKAIRIEATSGLLHNVIGFLSNAVVKSTKDHKNTGIEKSDKLENVLKDTDTKQVLVLKDG